MLLLIILIIFLSILLFLINYFVGRILSHTEAGLFPYSSFSFTDRDDNFSSNFFLKIVNPTIFLAFVTGIIQQMNLISPDSLLILWWIIPGYWICRLIYLIIMNHLIVINKRYELYSCIASNILGYVVLRYFILKLINLGESVFIPLTELRDAIWYAIFAYCCVAIWKILKSSFFNRHNIYTNSNRDAILMKKYSNFKLKYNSYISDYISTTQLSKLEPNKQDEFILLLYSIMIYEDFNRPPVVRKIEIILKRIFPSKISTIGIMQVRTTHIISDESSIRIAIDLLGNVYYKYLSVPEEIRIQYCINEYNSGAKYYNEVNAIYNRLKEMMYEKSILS